jgi:hypothetical protein
MSDRGRTFIVDKSVAGHWRVTLDNPPINVIDDGMYDAFYDLVAEIEADAALKVVTFESANPDFFIAHYGTSGPRSRFGVPRGDKAGRQRCAEHRGRTWTSPRRRQRVRLGVRYSVCQPGEGNLRATLDPRGRSA